MTSADDAYEDDAQDGDGEGAKGPMSCDRLRRKINALLASKEMTQTAFLKRTGANYSAFSKFMSYKGACRGIDNSTYRRALGFFAEREKQAQLKRKHEQLQAPADSGLGAAQGKRAASCAAAADWPPAKKQREGEEAAAVIETSASVGLVKAEAAAVIETNAGGLTNAGRLDESDDARSAISVFGQTPSNLA